MKKIKILIALVILSLVFINLLPANAASNKISVGDNVKNSVYTLSETEYDEETNKVSYQKISYSKQTYQTMTCTSLDAAGQSVAVSDDAQYVFIPARYLNLTDNTVLSIKYKNNGVKNIYLHAEYNAGISKGGVDYEKGYTIVCLNALATDPNEAWNATQSKSVDGYDVATVIFGNYTKVINDFLLTGFRLYFDYGVGVNNEKTFEIFGYEVHEQDSTPTFTTDPRPTRFSKLSSNDVTIKNNSFTVESNATVSAKILEFRPEAYKAEVEFNLSAPAHIDFKLDNNTVISKDYGKGTHTAYFELTEENYEKLDMVITGNVNVKIINMAFRSPATIDTLSGSGFTVTGEDNSNLVAKYNYIKSWNTLKGSIRNYNDDYQYLSLKFNLSHPTVIGVYVNDSAIRSHYTYATPLSAGDNELLLDVTEFDLLDGVLKIYVNPGDADPTNNVGEEKTITFSEVKLLRADDLPKTNITINSNYEFEYDGKGHAVTDVTAEPAFPITVEYKLESDSDDNYSTEAPVNAGVYNVRVSTPFTEVNGKVYGKTYAYAMLTITKADADKPLADDVTFDYAKELVYYNEDLFVVALDSEFTKIIPNGGYICEVDKIYVKYFSSANYNESEALELELNRPSKLEIIVDGVNESTLDAIDSTIEYSTDGINWFAGNGETVSIQPGVIYIFRQRATATSFASVKTYISVVNPKLEASQLSLVKTRPTTIELNAVEGAEYRLADGSWQDSNTFSNLTFGDKVEVFMRIKAEGSTYASNEVSIIIEVGIGVSRVAQVVEKAPVANEEPEINEDDKEVELPENNDEVLEDETEALLPANTYVATTFAELKTLVTNSSNKFVTTIIVKGEIVITSDLTINGKVVIKGEDGATLIVENGTKKTTIYNSTNSEITFQNIKFVRTITDNTEGFLFRFHSNGLVWFRDVEFDVVVTEGGVNSSYDRITYVPSGIKVTIYFDNCNFNTDGIFYRGTMIFYNSDADELPATGGSPTIYDFRKFKVDYVTKTFTFPGKYNVSDSDDFSILLESGCQFASNTTYYIKSGDLVFTYTTDDIQLAKPTIEDVKIDYINETISFASKYLVSKNAEFTQLVNSGDVIVPGMTLYIKEVATGIYMDSEVAVITIPSRPQVSELTTDYVCSFGCAIKYYPNTLYKLDGEYQESPVFVGLESGKTYTVTIYLDATNDSFASETYEIQVTLK